MALAFSIYHDSCNRAPKSCTYAVFRRHTGSSGAWDTGHQCGPVSLHLSCPYRAAVTRTGVRTPTKHADMFSTQYHWTWMTYTDDLGLIWLASRVCEELFKCSLIYFAFHAKGICSQCYKHPGLWAWWMATVFPSHTFRSSGTIHSWRSRAPWRTWLTLIV